MVQHLLLMMVAPPLLWLGAPLFPVASGRAAARAHVWVAPWLCRADRCADLWPLDPPADGARPFRRRHLGLACPARLRPGPPLERLALPAARVLPGHGPRVLVSHHPALPGPASLVALAAAPVPVPGRPVEHRFGGPVDVLRPRAVPLLRGGAAPGGALRPWTTSRQRVLSCGFRAPRRSSCRCLASPSNFCLAEDKASGVSGRRSADGRQRPEARGRGAPGPDLIACVGFFSALRSPTCNLGFDLLRVPLLGRFPEMATRPALLAGAAVAVGRR